MLGVRIVFKGVRRCGDWIWFLNNRELGVIEEKDLLYEV